MTIKQFKTKFYKIISSIEKEVDKIKDLADDVDDEELSVKLNDFADNITMLACEPTLETISSDVNLNSVLEFIDELEGCMDDYSEDEDSTDDDSEE